MDLANLAWEMYLRVSASRQLKPAISLQPLYTGPLTKKEGPSSLTRGYTIKPDPTPSIESYGLDTGEAAE
jgi:hypothetical protein